MEHLGSYDASRTLRVPCLCPEGFDGGSFLEYPIRKGWDVSKLAQGDLDGKSAREAAAFLQAWMYFGALHETFSAPLEASYRQSDFIEDTGSGSAFVTTERLGSLILDWHGREARAEADIKQKRFIRMKNCFRWLIVLVERFCRCDEARHAAEPNMFPLHPLIGLSIIVLADTLTYAGFKITGYKFDIDWGASNYLVKRMRDVGWCPRAIGTLRRGQQIHNLYYASTLGPPADVKDHGGCTEVVCSQDQIDMSTYSTLHRPGCSGCALVEVPLDKVLDSLKEGRIPVMSCHVNGDDARLEVSESAETTSSAGYVAISHVWADGLGNPNQNALHACQVKYIQNLVDSLQGNESLTPCRWWCDTLCIPVGVEHKQLRNAAIRQMRSVYSEATSVLVLDKGLMQIFRDRGAVELYIRLKLCSWMSRLWTLQEGVLGIKVHVQFYDGPRSLEDIYHALADEEAQKNRNLYRRYSFLSGALFGPFCEPAESTLLLRIPKLWRALQYRSTSHRRDETVCLATLLGLDPVDLLDMADTDYEGRMVALLKLLKVVPLNMLWQPPPRLSSPGFRWAPMSFLNCFRGARTNPFRVIQGTGEVHPRG